MAVDTYVVVAAAYDDEASALADYQEVKQAYRESDLIDTYDAAVISRDEHGKVHIVKKHEQPTRHGALAGLGIGLVGGVVVALFPAVLLAGGLFWGGAIGAAVGALAGHAAGGMRRADLKELGELLDDGQSGLVVVAASDMSDRVEQSVRRTDKILKKEMKADRKQVEADVEQASSTS